MGTIKDNKVDMLHGAPAKPMMAFALPLLAGGVLQQSFNSVDIAVAGRFIGSEALAATGSNGAVVGLIVNMFLGLSIGVNVVIANYIGQGNRRGVQEATGATGVLSLLCGVAMMLVTLIVAEPLLVALDTPAEVLPLAVEYLRIFALGMPFMLIYNFGAAVLRSVGDTRRPFYSLVAAGIVNVALNLVFVILMGMGIAGVAWGTVISNVVNAAVIVVLLARETTDVRLSPAGLRWHSPQVARIARIGLPAGLQTTVFSISNVFILGAINSFGAKASAGSAAALIYESYCYFIIVAFAQTVTAFVGQNYGAGHMQRVRRIIFLGLVMCTAVSAVFDVGFVALRSAFLMPFTDDAEVMHFAAIRMTTVLLFQFIASYYEIVGGAMRGMGHSMTPALITIFGTCLLRLVWLFFLPAGAPFWLLMAVYPVSWALTDAMMWVAMRRCMRTVAPATKADLTEVVAVK